MKKPLVYIASPYTQGDAGMNVRSVSDVMNYLLDVGECVPYSPIVATHLQHIIAPREYNEWLEYCFDFIHHCDALLRVNAAYLEYFQEESAGADAEVHLAQTLGMPVFTDLESLEHWLEAQSDD